METKRIVECLRRCEKITVRADCVGCDYLYLGGLDCYHVLKKDARERLEELERKKENLIDHNADLNNRLNKAESHIEKMGKQKEAMLKELCDKENLVREAEGRFYELEKELDTLKNATKKQTEPEWISVEDRLPEKKDELCLVYRKDGSICLSVHYCETNHYWSYGDVTHWMPLPEPPKPKEPTFKDVFLEKFPKANYDLIVEALCVCAFFPQFDVEKNVCLSEICEQCWNQPYFEEEGEADA